MKVRRLAGKSVRNELNVGGEALSPDLARLVVDVELDFECDILRNLLAVSLFVRTEVVLFKVFEPCSDRSLSSEEDFRELGDVCVETEVSGVAVLDILDFDRGGWCGCKGEK